MLCCRNIHFLLYIGNVIINKGRFFLIIVYLHNSRNKALIMGEK
jgi:hypothetical protein